MFDRIRGSRADQGAHRPEGRSLDWAAEFAHPAPPGRWTVQPADDTWRIIDGSGVVRLLCDHGVTVRTIDGDRLLSLAPDIAGTILPNTSDGLIQGALDAVLGSSSAGHSSEGSVGPKKSSRLIRDSAGLVIARVTCASENSHIELLPGGPLNNKLLARRLPPDLATRIRALGPLGYTITAGDPTDGAGQLRGPAGQLIATDRFTYAAPVRRSGTLHRELGAWTIEVDNNPFPTPWLFALLTAAKTVT